MIFQKINITAKVNIKRPIAIRAIISSWKNPKEDFYN